MKELTIEEKQLLLIDLCARLSYGVKISVHLKTDVKDKQLIGTLYSVYPQEERVIVDELSEAIAYCNVRCGGFLIEEAEIKPYLRPMSSMTSDEFKEFTNIVEHICIGKLQINIANPEAFDWLNAHHFDYRGLIEKGLAIEAPEGMYKNY